MSNIGENFRGRERRRATRTYYQTTCKIITDHQFNKCHLEDISMCGCRIDYRDGHAIGVGKTVKVDLMELGLFADGIVRWANQSMAGLEFMNLKVHPTILNG